MQRRFTRNVVGFLAALLPLLSGLASCAVLTPGAEVSGLGLGHVLFIDFAGASIVGGASDDAMSGVSALGAATVPPFDASIVAAQVPAASVVDVLVDRVRTLYLPFGVEVVTVAPMSGDYARVLVGGTAAGLTPAAPNTSAGIATLDCTDANPRSLGFAFSDSASPKFGGPVALAATIAHEAGHGFGLEHVTTTTDPMYAVGVPQQTLADLFALAFTTGSYSSFVAGGGSQAERCGRADPLDDIAILDAALGPRSPASQPPTVSIDFPPPVPTVPTVMLFKISAADDIAVRRVEVYRDLTLVATLSAPPYQLTLSLPTAVRTRITVEAIDDEAQRARAVLEVAVDPAAPQPCDLTAPCPAGFRCVTGACTSIDPPAEDAGLTGDGGVTPSARAACGIAAGHVRSSPAAAVICLLLLLALYRNLESRRARLGSAPHDPRRPTN